MRMRNYLFAGFVIGIVLVLLNLYIFISVFDYKKRVTGLAAETGFVNITIQTAIIIELYNDDISWGRGSIDSGEPNATLYTNGSGDGIVLRGNWSGINVTGFLLRNIGNVNCSVYIRAGKDAHDFFNSTSSSNERYMLNITNKDIDSCSGSEPLGFWEDVNLTGSGTRYCDQFSFDPDSNEVYIDVLMTVPRDSNNVGYQYDTLTIIGDVAV